MYTSTRSIVAPYLSLASHFLNLIFQTTRYSSFSYPPQGVILLHPEISDHLRKKKYNDLSSEIQLVPSGWIVKRSMYIWST